MQFLSYTLKVPFGSITTVTGIADYIYQFFILLIKAAALVSVAMLIYGGVVYIVSGTNALKKAAAFKRITQALIGIIFIFGSFVLLNALNPQLTLLSGLDLPFLPALPSPPPGCGNGALDLGEACDGANFGGETCATVAPSTPFGNLQCSGDCSTINSSGCSAIAGGTCAGIACNPPQWLTNTSCNPDPAGCTGAQAGAVTNVNVYNTVINAGAAMAGSTICGSINTVKMLKSIAVNESSGITSIIAADKQSAGFYQITPATAKLYATPCGVNPALIVDTPDDETTPMIDESNWVWLINPSTIKAQSCMAALFLKNIASSSCGCNIRGLAVGYNSGTGGCRLSIYCSSCNFCSPPSGPTKKWECLWDNGAHTACNTGYVPTRRYAPRVENCYTNIF